MAPEQLQAMVDAEEADLTARYERRRRIADIVDDAAKRDDAMSRLEAWLRFHPEPPQQAA